MKRAVLAAAVTCLVLGSLAHAGETAPKARFLNSPEALQRNRPFSEAVHAGDFLFLAGQLGDSGGKVVPGGLAPEARQALQNVKDLLERNGASLGDVVKCTVFLADIAEWPAFNEIYRDFFKSPYPARSALAASGLALNARVEVECIAYVPQLQAAGSK
jgi:reactive intermediate/imine deaminase